jgi:DNA-binding protein HU-beta
LRSFADRGRRRLASTIGAMILTELARFPGSRIGRAREPFPRHDIFLVRRTLDMNKGDLVATVADKTGTSRTQAGEVIEAALTAITETLKKGEEVKLVGFGTFVVTDRPAGMARNPRTNEQIAVPASKAPKFKAGQGLKDAVNNRG